MRKVSLLGRQRPLCDDRSLGPKVYCPARDGPVQSGDYNGERLGLTAAERTEDDVACLAGHSESTCVTIGKRACKHRVAPGVVFGQ